MGLPSRTKDLTAALAAVIAGLACAGQPSTGSSVSQISPNSAAQTDTVAADCVLPSTPEIRIDDNGMVLMVWSFPLQDIHSRAVLPDDSGLLAYRAAVRADSADLRRPVADPPTIQTENEAEMWRNEDYNTDLAYAGEVGAIEPIRCLDALLFAEQNSRVSELDHPTEFLASVLRRDSAGTSEVAIVFGAGRELFPPKSVYGFDVVDEFRKKGWSFWYVLHNHTLQKNGARLALGVPVPSTSDVQLARNLAKERGLQSVRVTNGFYSFDASVEDMTGFRSR